MSDTVIKVENLSKLYRLGVVGTGTLSHDLNRWWHKVRGKEDPYTKIGETNDRGSRGDSEYVWALKDINFEVKQGEVLGIIGKNGAGKSTLLKILSKVTGPTTGSIKAKGRIASLLEVGTGFHPELTGRENIYLNGTILGMTKAEVSRKLDEIVEFAGVARYVDTPVKRYSSGMKVRLGFAVAAHLEPEILIVDEVLAVGDVTFQKKSLGKMEEVSSEGRTVLFVSHNMQMISQLCQNIIVLQDGKIHFEGNTSDGIGEYYRQSVVVNNESKHGGERNRRGSGLVRFYDLKITDTKGQEKVSYKSTEDILITTNYQVKDKIGALQVAIALKSTKSREIITKRDFTLSHSPLSAGHHGDIKIRIPGGSLMPGIYPTYFWMGNNLKGANIPWHERTFDVLDDVTLPISIAPEPEADLHHVGYFQLNAQLEGHKNR